MRMLYIMSGAGHPVKSRSVVALAVVLIVISHVGTYLMSNTALPSNSKVSVYEINALTGSTVKAWSGGIRIYRYREFGDNGFYDVTEYDLEMNQVDRYTIELPWRYEPRVFVLEDGRTVVNIDLQRSASSLQSPDLFIYDRESIVYSGNILRALGEKRGLTDDSCIANKCRYGVDEDSDEPFVLYMPSGQSSPEIDTFRFTDGDFVLEKSMQTEDLFIFIDGFQYVGERLYVFVLDREVGQTLLYSDPPYSSLLPSPREFPDSGGKRLVVLPEQDTFYTVVQTLDSPSSALYTSAEDSVLFRERTDEPREFAKESTLVGYLTFRNNYMAVEVPLGDSLLYPLEKRSNYSTGALPLVLYLLDSTVGQVVVGESDGLVFDDSSRVTYLYSTGSTLLYLYTDGSVWRILSLSILDLGSQLELPGFLPFLLDLAVIVGTYIFIRRRVGKTEDELYPKGS